MTKFKIEGDYMLISFISIAIMFAFMQTVKRFTDVDKRVLYITKEDLEKIDVSDFEELKEDVFVI